MPKCHLKTGLTSRWVPSQKTQPGQRSGEGRMHYSHQVRRTWELSQCRASPTARLGRFQAKGTCVFVKGPEQGRSQHRIRAGIDRVQASVDWSHGGHRWSASPSLRFPLTWWLSFRLTFTIDSELRVFTTGVLSLLLLFLLPDNSRSFFPSRSLVSEACSRASAVSRLRSQNGSGQTWLLFCQESPAWFSLWGTPHPVCLQSYYRWLEKYGTVSALSAHVSCFYRHFSIFLICDLNMNWKIMIWNNFCPNHC